ncbi:MAG: hypothetical protein HKL84_08895 [Acidimicrobiaceae bacterium]|nr:hypothetical protein [Acidimicrobiaceae bacterium]
MSLRNLVPQPILKRLDNSETALKAFKYTVASAVSVVISQVVLFLAFGVFHIWSATTSNFVAVAVSAVPSYYMNRAWAWGKTGRSHLFKEIVPFWGLAFLGLILSLWAVGAAEHFALIHHFPHLEVAVIVNVASIGAFGVLWIGKFIIFNKVIFAKKDDSELVSLLD